MKETIFAVIVFLIFSTVALAKELPQVRQFEDHAAPAFNKVMMKKFEKIRDSIAKDRNELALQGLDRILESYKRKPAVRAVALEMRGFVLSKMDRSKEAVESHLQCLALDRLPLRHTLQVLKALGQNLVSLERYSEALQVYTDLMHYTENMPSSSRLLYAQLLVKGGFVDEGLQLAESLTSDPDLKQEHLRRFLLASYVSSKRYPEAERHLLYLVEQNLQSRYYWLQLAGLYSMWQRRQDMLVSVQLAHSMGVLKGDDYLRLVQLSLDAGMPYQVASAMEGLFTSQSLKRSKQNLLLRIDAYVRANESKLALNTISDALNYVNDQSFYYRQAELLFNQEAWLESFQSLKKAQNLDNSKINERHQYLSAVSLMKMERYRESLQYFKALKSSKIYQKDAKYWISFIEERI